VIRLLPGLGLDSSDVVEAELVRIRVPLIHEHRAAHGSEAMRDVVLVRIALADGAEGWGECSALSRPTYTAEHSAGSWLVLSQELLPALLDGRRTDVVGHPMAKAGVEVAVTDALLRRAGRSLADVFAAGSPLVRALPATAVVGIGDSVEEVVAAVQRARAAGAAMVKCKVTPDAVDLAAVAEVRATWPDLALAVDWNQSATDDAFLTLAGLDLVYAEQPGPADDLVACARFSRLAREAGVAIALDESIDGPGSLLAAAALQAGTLANLKPARVGGLAATAATMVAACDVGWPVFVGGMLETGVGRAAALAVAAHPAMAFPTDLGPSARYFERDVTAPIDADADGRVVVPDGPGIGRTVDPDMLHACTVERVTFAPDRAPSADR
jgi:O-succinylbenzoate synthase